MGVKIFITDYIPSLNKGEAAILYGMLKSFKGSLGYDKVYLWSSNPAADKPRFEPAVDIIEATGLSISRGNVILKTIKLPFIIFRYVLFIVLYNIFGPRFMRRITKHGVWRAYLDSDIIIVAHDDAIGSKRFSLSCALNIAACFFLRKKSVIYAASIGFYNNIIPALLARYLLGKVNLLTFREEMSYNNFLRMVGCHPNAYVTADTAFLLEPALSSRIDEIMLVESLPKGNIPIVGLSVTCGSPVYERMFCGLKKVKKRDKYQAHIEIISKITAYLTQDLGAFVVFVPHVLGPDKNKDDRIISEAIYMNLKDKSRTAVITKEYTPGEIKGLIGNFSLFIGERLHSVFNAISMGVPAVSMSFPSDYRAYGIIGKQLQEERLLYDVEFLEFRSLLEKINEIWKDRDQIKNRLGPKIAGLKAKAMLNGSLLQRLYNNS